MGNKFSNGLNENLIRYEMRNAENIAVASTNIVNIGKNISVFEALLFNQ